MRIDFRIHDSEPAAEALRALPQRERANALRLMLRRHFGELPGLIGFRDPPRTTTANAAPPANETAAGAAEEVTAPASGTKNALRTALDALRARGTAATVVLATLATFAFAPVHTARAGEWRVDANLASYHTQQWARDSLNQHNSGIGIEYQANRMWAFAAGEYTNSYWRSTAYALVEFTPLRIGQPNHWHLDAGVAGGVASGYTRAEIPCSPFVGAALIRITAPDGIALNIMGVPNAGRYRSGFIGFQLSFPFTDGAGEHDEQQ